MFYRIKNNALYDYADFKYDEECKQTDIITQRELDEDRNKVIVQDGVLVLNPNYEKEQEKKEEERIAKLIMTPLDFVNFLIDLGLTDEQIDDYLANNKPIKRQLTYCQNVYCGVACSFMPITIGNVKITKKMVIEAFKNKNGEN